MAARKLTDRKIAKIRSLRYHDGLTIPVVAKLVGCSMNTVQKYAPGWPGKISVSRVQDIVLASNRTVPEIALNLGWLSSSSRSSGDGSRLRRVVGITMYVSSRGYKTYPKKMIDAELAERIAEAAGAEPWEVYEP